MKRDMDLCRKILLEIEEAEEDILNLEIEGYSQKEIKYNCKLLYENGFIEKFENYIDDSFSVEELTWAGNDYLDKIRNDNVWNKIKSVIKQQGIPMTITGIKIIAEKIANGDIKIDSISF